MPTASWISWWFPRRVLRLTAYAVCVCLCASALAGRAAYAQAKEAALAFGEQLIGLDDLTRGAHRIRVNGEGFHRAMVFSKDSLTRVLDRVQADCENTPGLLGQVGTHATNEHPRAFRKSPWKPNILRGIVRDEEERRGMVACFTDDRISGLGGLAEAAARFAKTSSLREFGHFRYAFAHRTENGQTLLVLLWADTDLKLSTMFPAVGDAAGDDSPVLPRPKGSRRTLSASVEGQPYGVRLYDTTESPPAIQRFYETWLQKRGWIPAGQAAGQGASYLRSDGYQAIITVAQRNGRTTVALSEAGRSEGSLVSTTVMARP